MSPTRSMISMTRFLCATPSLAISDGLVVTPSRMPQAFACLISSTLAVSMKNFMVCVPPQQQGRL